MATKFLRNRAALNSFTKSKSSHRPDYRKQISLANLLQRYGFPRTQINAFLNKNHFLLNSNLDRIDKSLSVLMSFKIPQKSLTSLIFDSPGVLDYDFLKNWVVGFRDYGDLGVGVPPLVVRSVLEHSLRFQIGPDGFKRSLIVLKGLGFSEGSVKRVLERFPGVMRMNECEIRKKFEFFIGLGVAENDVLWVIDSFPEVLGYGVENRLLPLVSEFESLGFSEELISKEIVREPRALSMEVGELSRCLELLKTLKCREPIKREILNEGGFRAGFSVKERIDCLCKHGLIRREAFKVLWKEPRVITYSIEDIEKKIEFLVNTMGFTVACLVEVPEYLGVNFEKQIVPRYSVISYLHSKGGLGDEVGLKGMMKLSRVKFFNLYVKPYPECQKLYGRFSGDAPVKRPLPVGLWKLFKPQKPPEVK